MKKQLPLAGIYIHIPFCTQACHYCDFHFSTNTQIVSDMMDAIAKEVIIQKNYLGKEKIQTIYFGGGTPSLIPVKKLKQLLDTIHKIHEVNTDVEITLEANPDDLSNKTVKELKQLGVNRLSIGIQTWNDPLLKFMNRAHSSKQAQEAIDSARAHNFKNISLDLIYGIPGQTSDMLEKDIKLMIKNNPEHISTYALTIEQKTVFENWKRKGKFLETTDETMAKQYELIMDSLTKEGYDHYEISNFSKPGFESKHNSSYWKGTKYLGVGPSAHSYEGTSRQFNISNNYKYVNAISNNTIPFEKEVLSDHDRINEYIFTSLRTHWGCDLHVLQSKFKHDLLTPKADYLKQLEEQSLITMEDNLVKLTNKGKLVADKIISDLFI